MRGVSRRRTPRRRWRPPTKGNTATTGSRCARSRPAAANRRPAATDRRPVDHPPTGREAPSSNVLGDVSNRVIRVPRETFQQAFNGGKGASDEHVRHNRRAASTRRWASGRRTIRARSSGGRLSDSWSGQCCPVTDNVRSLRSVTRRCANRRQRWTADNGGLPVSVPGFRGRGRGRRQRSVHILLAVATSTIITDRYKRTRIVDIEAERRMDRSDVAEYPRSFADELDARGRRDTDGIRRDDRSTRIAGTTPSRATTRTPIGTRRRPTDPTDRARPTVRMRPTGRTTRTRRPTRRTGRRRATTTRPTSNNGTART